MVVSGLPNITPIFRRIWFRKISSVLERETEPVSVLNGGRHNRRAAELSVRLAPYPGVSPGHPLAVAVRMDALHQTLAKTLGIQGE